ncbi:MAG: helix-turn-helix transcriptional regulator [Lachnospiraceae bacterium]|nr:helix-turn-helix transcriptional regulator [Lachnospiraceae bacterium]
MVNTAERLIQLREAIGLSKAAFASRAGYAQPTQRRYEEGITAISENRINQICNVFDVNKEWLVTGEGEMLNHPVSQSPATRLIQLRKELNMTQIEFAAMAGLTQNYVSLLESQKVEMTEKTARKICEAFDVGYTWLKYGKEAAKEYPVTDEVLAYLDEQPDLRKYIRDQMKR